MSDDNIILRFWRNCYCPRCKMPHCYSSSIILSKTSTTQCINTTLHITFQKIYDSKTCFCAKINFEAFLGSFFECNMWNYRFKQDATVSMVTSWLPIAVLSYGIYKHLRILTRRKLVNHNFHAFSLFILFLYFILYACSVSVLVNILMLWTG